MNTLYAIRDDGVTYQALDLQLSDLFDALSDLFDALPEEIALQELMAFSANNAALSSWWPTPSTAFIARPNNPQGPVPDLSLWRGATLVLSPRAFRHLHDALDSYGEFLPVEVEDQTYHIFNCLTFAEEDVDKTAYEYYGEQQMGLKMLAFTPAAQNLLVFKSKQQSCLTVYCNERFKSAGEAFSLTGVLFDTELVIPSPFETK